MASIFAVPAPVRELFKRFPLHIYDAEPLPARAPSATRALAQLYIFATDDAARTGLPSYNPTCLKWQVCLPVHPLALIPANKRRRTSALRACKSRSSRRVTTPRHPARSPSCYLLRATRAQIYRLPGTKSHNMHQNTLEGPRRRRLRG